MRRRFNAESSTASFDANLKGTQARSRSGQRSFANRELARNMQRDPKLRERMEQRFGKGTYERVKSGRNPLGAEWDHSPTSKYSLKLRSRGEHRALTGQQPGRVGGYARFYNPKSPNTLIGRAKKQFGSASQK